MNGNECGFWLESDSYEADHNLALEEWLFIECDKIQKPILMLWQNRNAVIIGRNQNAFTECNMEYVQSEGISVVRRMTGGGAVYHDMGNLNYSFILPRTLYDRSGAMQIIVNALAALGIQAEASGRNDICVNGKKVSGNAFYSNNRTVLHHGTLLYEVTKDRLSNALKVTEKKLAKNGIESVAARVTDLKTEKPEVGLLDIKDSVKTAFGKKYMIQPMQPEIINGEEVDKLAVKYGSENWNIYKVCEYNLVDTYIVNGNLLRMSMELEGERLEKVEIASDGMDPDLIDEVKAAFNLYLENNEVRSAEDLEMFFRRKDDSLGCIGIREAAMDLFGRKHN